MNAVNEVLLVSDVAVPGPSLDAARLMARAQALGTRGGTLLAPVGFGGPLMVPGVRHVAVRLGQGASAARREAQLADEVAAVLVPGCERYQIVHCQGVRAAVPALLSRRRARRVVVEPGFMPAQRIRSERPDVPAARIADLVALEDRVLRHADAVLVRTTVEAEAMGVRGVEDARIWVVPDGLPEVPSLSPPSPMPMLALVAGTGPDGIPAWLDWPTLFEALARLSRPWRLTVFTAKGVGISELRGRAERLGLARRVAFAHMDTGAEALAARLGAAQVFVCPLKADPGVVCGAVGVAPAAWGLAAGRRVVASDLPITRLVLGAHGSFVAPERPDLLAAALHDALAAAQPVGQIPARTEQGWAHGGRVVTDLWASLASS